MFHLLLHYTASKPQNVIIYDAGSSGTRVYLFKYTDSHDPNSFVTVNNTEGKMVNKKVNIRLADCDINKEYVPQIFDTLLSYVGDFIPDEAKKNTTVLLYATAGMRMIPKENQTRILKNVYDHIKQKYPYSISLSDCRVIEGYEEALFAWVSANRLLYKFVENAETTPIAEIGGASAQIAKAVNKEQREKVNKYVHTVQVGRFTYKVFSHSWLGYGFDRALESIHKSLLPSTESPCLFSDSTQKITVDGEEIVFTGKGNFDECYKIASKVVYKKCKDGLFYDGEECVPSPGGFSEVYGLGTINFQSDVLNLPELSSVKKFDAAAKELAAKNWSTAEKWYLDTHDNNPNSYFWQAFPQETIISNFLIEGFDLADKDIPMRAHNIEGIEPMWTLGAVMAKYSRAVDIDYRKLWTIVGSCAAGLVAIIVIIVIIVVVRKRRNANEKAMTESLLI